MTQHQRAGGAVGPVPGATRRFGEAAVLVSTGGTGSTRRLAEQLRQDDERGVIDVVGGLRSVLVTVDPDVIDPEDYQVALAAAALAHTGPDGPDDALPGRTIVVPTIFDGPDLADVARRLGGAPEAVVAALVDAELRVVMLGFSPGFAYLGGLPAELEGIPRRDAPRPVVPAGSLALADGFAAVYPQGTPGGWQLVGRTSLRLFDPIVPPHALLAPGDTVRLEVSAGPAGGPAPASGEPSAPAPRRRGPLAVPGGAAALFEVEQPGMLTTTQDRGRLGYAHLGVPTAGPADPASHRLANLLVGNPGGAVALEVTAHGPRLRCLGAAHVAVVGGHPDVSLDGRPVDGGRVLPVAAGQLLAVGTTAPGLRTYLAVAGGVLVPSTLGSRSTDTLSWLGPGPLGAGDRVGGGPPGAPLADHLVPGPGRSAGAGPGIVGGRLVVRVVPGPHPEWFPAGVLEGLSHRPMVVRQDGRVGLRLEAVGGPLPRVAGELESQGMVTGAVQVPPDGQPIVLLPDHATVGGYPVLAVVISADLVALGQCRIGDEIRLAPVSFEEAVRARRAGHERLGRAVAGHYPVVPA